MMMMDKDDHERARDRDRGGRRDRPTRFSSSDRDRSPDRGKERGGMKSSNCRVYVSNIPYEFRWQDLKDLFRQQVGEVAFVELFVDENDKARGCGIVEFAEPSAAKKCLEVMHRFDLKGRKMVIKEDFGNQRDKYGNLVGGGKGRRDRDNNDRGGDRGRDERRYEQHGPSGSGSGGPIVGNTYGLSPAFLDDLKIQTPLNTRVFVANLEYKVDKKKLKEVFRMAGKVMSVDMPLAKDGTSRGFAVVEYDHPVESVQAISMFNGQPLYDRPMTVRMDRGPERDKLPDGLKSIGNGLGSNGEPLRDVARNLPSLINQPPAVAANLNSGAGILGAVPNLQLGAAANALGSLSSTALSNLGTTQAAVLQQAASLGLSNNLLAGSLGGGDIGLGAANLLQNNPSLAALAASSNSMNSAHNNSFNRGDNNQSGGGFMSNNQGNNNYGGNGGGNNQSNMGGGQNMGRNSYSTGYESSKSQGGYGGFGNNGGNDRDNRPQQQQQHNNSGGNNMYSSMNNGGNQMMRGGGGNMMDRKKCKLLISNLPPTAQYKLITEKCQEFGAVENFEEQGVGSLMVTFMTEWDAERAMKNIDRARIDGRTIDARVI